MKVLVFGSPNWINYNELVRQLTLVVEDAKNTRPDDKKILFVHTGRNGAETMVTEWIGKIEKFMRQKEYSIKEELVRSKSVKDIDKLTADYDMIKAGADLALVFIRSSDKRGEYCARITEEFNIPTKIVRER